MRRTQLITTAALVATCAAPTSAIAQTQDLRSPDTRDAAVAAEAPSYQDLRSPDARDADRAAGTHATEARTYRDLRSADASDAARVAEDGSYQDLRSPDARDAARDLPPVQTPVQLVEVAQPSSGFDWGAAGIGAAGMLALLSICAGLTMGVVQSRRRRGSSALAH